MNDTKTVSIPVTAEHSETCVAKDAEHCTHANSLRSRTNAIRNLYQEADLGEFRSVKVERGSTPNSGHCFVEFENGTVEGVFENDPAAAARLKYNDTNTEMWKTLAATQQLATIYVEWAFYPIRKRRRPAAQQGTDKSPADALKKRAYDLGIKARDNPDTYVANALSVAQDPRSASLSRGDQVELRARFEAGFKAQRRGPNKRPNRPHVKGAGRW
jgi:hypothetical protein